MATIFLDTNILIDLYDRDQSKIIMLASHKLYVSTLSCHILCYANKIKIPDSKLNILLANLSISSVNSAVLKRALTGPTADLEDNIQLHSSAISKCQYFLSRDNDLLKMQYFGSVAIVDSL